MLLQFLIVCLHFFARLKTRKTALKDLYTYPYVEYSKLCTISTYPGRLSNNAATSHVWAPDALLVTLEGEWFYLTFATSQVRGISSSRPVASFAISSVHVPMSEGTPTRTPFCSNPIFPLGEADRDTLLRLRGLELTFSGRDFNLNCQDYTQKQKARSIIRR